MASLGGHRLKRVRLFQGCCLLIDGVLRALRMSQDEGLMCPGKALRLEGPLI